MTPERQMIVIGEACGWQIHPKDKWVVIPPNSPNSVQPLSTIPDYLNDLNAMHEAEKVLTRNQRHDYMDALEIIAGDLAIDEWDVITSTAAQRAEAFIKTLNKWEES